MPDHSIPGPSTGLVLLVALAAAAAGCDGGSVEPAPAGPYEIIELGTLGSHSWAADINDDGVVVGSALAADGRRHPFRWEAGAMTDLAGAGGEATAINAHGDIVGSLGSGAALWRDGSFVDLGMLEGHSYSVASDINDSGRILGRSVYWPADPRTGSGAMHALAWEDPDLAPADLGPDLWLTALDERGTAVGCYQEWADQAFWCTTGIIRREGTVSDLGIPPLDQWVQGVDIDAEGRVLVRRPATGSFLLWQDGTFTEHRYPDRVCTVPTALGPDGTVVGYTCGTSAGYAFLWQDGEWTDLSARAREELGDSAAAQTRALAINRAGQIVGYRVAEDGQQRAILWDPRPVR